MSRATSFSFALPISLKMGRAPCLEGILNLGIGLEGASNIEFRRPGGECLASSPVGLSNSEEAPVHD